MRVCGNMPLWQLSHARHTLFAFSIIAFPFFTIIHGGPGRNRRNPVSPPTLASRPLTDSRTLSSRTDVESDSDHKGEGELASQNSTGRKRYVVLCSYHSAHQESIPQVKETSELERIPGNFPVFSIRVRFVPRRHHWTILLYLTFDHRHVSEEKLEENQSGEQKKDEYGELGVKRPADT